jgi:hypothetical protein
MTETDWRIWQSDNPTGAAPSIVMIDLDSEIFRTQKAFEIAGLAPIHHRSSLGLQNGFYQMVNAIHNITKRYRLETVC